MINGDMLPTWPLMIELIISCPNVVHGQNEISYVPLCDMGLYECMHTRQLSFYIHTKKNPYFMVHIREWNKDEQRTKTMELFTVCSHYEGK